MANRTMGAVDGTALFACSICGVSARFPGELKYTADRLFVHSDDRHGKDRPLIEENSKRGRMPLDQQSPRFPVGVMAGWQVMPE